MKKFAITSAIITASLLIPGIAHAEISEAAKVCQTQYTHYGFRTPGECTQHVARGGELVSEVAISVTYTDWFRSGSGIREDLARTLYFVASNLEGTTATFRMTTQSYDSRLGTGITTTVVHQLPIVDGMSPPAPTSTVKTLLTGGVQCSKLEDVITGRFISSVTVTTDTGQSGTWITSENPCLSAPWKM